MQSALLLLGLFALNAAKDVNENLKYDREYIDRLEVDVAAGIGFRERVRKDLKEFSDSAQEYATSLGDAAKPDLRAGLANFRALTEVTNANLIVEIIYCDDRKKRWALLYFVLFLERVRRDVNALQELLEKASARSAQDPSRMEALATFENYIRDLTTSSVRDMEPTLEKIDQHLVANAPTETQMKEFIDFLKGYIALCSKAISLGTQLSC